MQKQTLSNELQQLITQIRSIKNSERSGDFTILNQKIRFIEAIMAEQSTEVELMKKHYFGLNSNKKKGKIGDFNHRKSRVGEAYIKGHKKEKRYMNQQGSMPHNKPLFQDTTSTHRNSRRSVHLQRTTPRRLRILQVQTERCLTQYATPAQVVLPARIPAAAQAPRSEDHQQGSLALQPCQQNPSSQYLRTGLPFFKDLICELPGTRRLQK